MSASLTVAELVAAALAADDEDARWDIVCELHDRNDPETFQAAQEQCRHSDVEQRRLGVDVIAQLGGTVCEPEARPFRAPGVTFLLGLVTAESDPDVLAAIAVAFGHLDDPRGIPALSQLSAHPDPDVRAAVAFGLHSFDGQDVLAALLALSRDPEAEVRNWATFGLGRERANISVETENLIRDALADRLDDSDDETSAEAIEGLARFGDPRATAPLLAELESDDCDIAEFVLTEALYSLAAKTGDPALCRHVGLRYHDWLATHQGESPPEELVAALRRCGEVF